MLNIGLRWVLRIFAVVVFFLIVNAGLQHWIMLPSFSQLEYKQANSHLSRVTETLLREAQHMVLLSSDWAAWDDTYSFVKHRQQAYIDSNFVWKTLEGSTGINLMYICDNEGRVVWGEAYDSSQGGKITLKEFPADSLGKQNVLVQHASVNSSVSGLIQTEKGILIVSSLPIVTSQAEGPVRGSLIMGRFLNESLLEKIKIQTKIDFSTFPVSDIAEESVMQSYMKRLELDSSVIEEVDDNVLHIYGMIKDLSGKAVLLIRGNLDRDIMVEGRSASRLVSISVLFSLGFLAVVLFLMFGYYAVRMRKANRRIAQLVEKRTRQLRDAKDDAEDARKEAEDANHIKSIFLANMSHEIRTPMNTIIGMTNLCLQTQMTSKQQGYLTNVFDSATLLLKIINNILDFTKIEAGKVEFEDSDFYIDAVLTNLSAVVSQQAAEKNIQLIYDIHKGVPAVVNGDLLRFGQVILNLVENAIKFTDKGWICLSIKLLNELDDTVALEFLVEDTGIGMSTSVVDKMFESFSQPHQSTYSQTDGRGLGLNISRELLMLMGGEIHVTSQPEKGTQVCCTVTFKTSSQKSSADSHAGKGQQIFVLGENEKVVTGIAHTLTACGCMVTTSDAIRTTTDLGYDAIFIDDSIAQPKLIDFLNRADHILQHKAHIIVLTNHNETPAELCDIALSNISLSFLNKPVCWSSFYEVMGIQQKVGVSTALSAYRDNDLVKEATVSLKNKRVLLVEDNEINAQIVFELLADVGVNVLYANDGVKAIKLLEKSTVDVVLMDINMPRMDGIEATRQIRSKPEWRSMPIIALTANAMVGDRENALNVGMDDYLVKPIFANQLYIKLIRWCHHQDTNACFSGSLKAHVPVVSEATQIIDGDESFDVNVTMKGIDVEAGLLVCAGKFQLLQNIWRQFADKYRSIYADIVDALNAQDYALVSAMTHNLKGLSANIGALLLSDVASSINRQIETGMLPINETLLKKLEQQLNDVISSIDGHLSEEQEDQNEA